MIMESHIIELEAIDLVPTVVLIVIALSLSRWQQLGLEASFILSAGRAFLQLVVAGYGLAFIFTLETVWGVGIALLVMMGLATLLTRNLISQTLSKGLAIAGGSLFITTSLTLCYVIFLIIQPPTWYDPQYWIPLAGLIMGSAVNGATVAGEQLVQALENNHHEIETHLCLGATPNRAIAGYRRQAMRAGIFPILNQMTVVALVTLPGVLSGQLLSGVSPITAVSYEIMILFTLSLANVLITIFITEGIYRQFFNANAQLRL